MTLLDTHQHAWDLRQFPYAWCAGIPALNRSFTVHDYAAAAARLGIAKTLFMECDVDEPHALDEARHIEALAGAPLGSPDGPIIAGIVASGRPEREGFRSHLAALAALPHVRGVRRILHTQPDELSRSPLFAENLRLLPDLGFTFDLCVLARQLPIAEELVRRCPGVTFILDHCGVPDVKGRAFDPWREHLHRIAAYPNVNCKISGIVAYADPAGWTVDDLRPWVEHVLECFGWDRVVWGGDWPVCTLAATLRQWVEATGALVAGASEDQRARLFHANAERIYRV
jgi:predicted TIM-barrel fold metal-dependent hydrolase